MFLQAIKIVNMVKLKEEFDYEGLCRKLEHQVDHLTAEVERKQKLREDDKYKLEKELKECQDSFAEAKRNLITRSEVVVFPISFKVELIKYQAKNTPDFHEGTVVHFSVSFLPI